jgi:hypothetical protein
MSVALPELRKTGKKRKKSFFWGTFVMHTAGQV